MAKKKIKLSEIKDALLSNTSFIKNEEKPVEEKVVVPENAVEIDLSTLKKIKLLANYYKKDAAELINEAIAHYLRLKRLDIEDALKNIVVGDDEE
ncbi:MAG: hypothetical protein HC831_08650 [Chloroflexia bacterium]|nr:hypothetical protein [Chloroflexia bacterium]